MVRKVTFTLDEITIHRLNMASERFRKPKSEVVRDAIADYHERAGKLSEVERQRMLRVVRELVPKIPKRPLKEVEEEIEAARSARRAGGRGGMSRGSR
jgi:predicted DNA-binding protein